jgi:hypothetical protein
VKRRQVLDDDGVDREPFDRSEATWRRLDAPPDLWDAAAAAEAWNSYTPAGWRLDGFPEHPARQILAHRHWAWARPAFLAEVGALTPDEAGLLERWPRLHAPPSRVRAAAERQHPRPGK